MLGFLEPLRILTSDNNIWVTLFRLGVAALCGGVIGLERGRKRRPAGFRTHMMVCIGAALAMLISQYLTMMTTEFWCDIVPGGGNTDVARLGAQVINGIGFLGAGTIIVTGHQEVKGLTTAAGLWASACMGLTIGAGYYFCVISALIAILFVVQLLPFLEAWVLVKARNINLYIEFESLADLGEIIGCMKEQNVRIYEMEIDHADSSNGQRTGAFFALHMDERQLHTKFVLKLSELDCIHSVEEL